MLGVVHFGLDLCLLSLYGCLCSLHPCIAFGHIGKAGLGGRGGGGPRSVSIEIYSKSQHVCDTPGGKLHSKVIFISGNIFLISDR